MRIISEAHLCRRIGGRGGANKTAAFRRVIRSGRARLLLAHARVGAATKPIQAHTCIMYVCGCVLAQQEREEEKEEELYVLAQGSKAGQCDGR